MGKHIRTRVVNDDSRYNPYSASDHIHAGNPYPPVYREQSLCYGNREIHEGRHANDGKEHEDWSDGENLTC